MVYTQLAKDVLTCCVLVSQARQASAIEKSSIPEAQHQQQDILYDEHEVGSMAALEEDDTLPTSTQMSMQEHMADTVSAADSLSAPSMQGPHLLPESNSVGHLSVMSDGSFIHVGGPASAGDAECQEGLEARTLLDDTMAVDLTGPAVVEDVAQEANTVDRLSEGTSEHVAEFLSEHAEAVGESDKACSLTVTLSMPVPPHFMHYMVWLPDGHVTREVVLGLVLADTTSTLRQHWPCVSCCTLCGQKCTVVMLQMMLCAQCTQSQLHHILC